MLRPMSGARSRQLVVNWDEAPGVIAQAIGERAPGRPRAIAAVTGPVGAGKSTLAARLTRTVITTDDYLPDYDAVQMHQRDLPEFADLARLAGDLRILRDTGEARIPVWSFQTHRREGERPVIAAQERLIVVEGIHALHESVALVTDVRIYVDAPRATRLARWELRERRGERGWSVDEALAFFDAVAEPTFAIHAPRYRESADIIVTNG